MFKVRREGLKTICDTCRDAQIMTDRMGNSKIICHAGRSIEIPVPLESCSLYQDIRRPNKYEMEAHAWLLITEARHGRNVGFVSPEERKKDNKDIDEY